MSLVFRHAKTLAILGVWIFAAALLAILPSPAVSQSTFTPWKVDTGNDWVATSTYTGGNSGWVNTGSVLPAAVMEGRAAVIGGYVYLFGGWRSGSVLNTIYRAPLATPTIWASALGVTLPGAVEGQSVVVIGNYVYSFGGYNGSSWSRVIYRAPVADPTTWTNTGALIPVGLSDPAVAIIGNYIYLFGGGTGVLTNTNAIYRASLADPLTWTTTGATLPASLKSGQIAVIGNYVYLFGGSLGNGTEVNTIYRAAVSDPLTWSNTGATLPINMSNGQLAIIGDYVYIFATNSGGATIYRAALATPTVWAATGSSLPAYLENSAVAIINNNVYLFGGYTTVATNLIYRAPLTLLVSAPSAPQTLAASGVANAVNLTWAAPASNGNAAITNYKIYRDTAAGATTLLATVGNVLSYADSTAAPYTAYYYRVTAVNSAGESSYSNEVSAAATSLPTAPGTPSFSSITTSGMTIDWSAATYATTYKLERCSGVGCSSFSQIAAGLASPTYTDSGLAANTSYTYRVRATNAVGDGSYSPSATQQTSMSPQAPAGSGTALTGWAWSDNIGWISMNCQTGGAGSSNICGTRNYGVAVDGSGNVTGYAWSDSIGWIQFGGLSSFPSGTGTVAQNAAFASSSLKGWVRACEGTATGDCGLMTDRADGWDGWVSLFGSTYGPSLSGSSLTGYAWGGEAIGWIDFSRVSTSYQPCAATQNYMCVSGNSQHTGADCVVTTDICSSHGAGWFCSGSNGLCTAPPPPVFGTNGDGSSGVLTTKPTLVRSNYTTKVIWTVNNATSCTVTGTNGDSWSATASVAGGYTSRAITTKTTYSIHCAGNGGTLDASTIVNIIPSWQEK